MAIQLNRNAYSPRLLAEELSHFLKSGIYSQIRKGKLKARRLGGKKLLIFKEDAEAWLASLPSATEPASLDRPKEKRSGAKERKSIHDVAFEHQHRKRMAAWRAEQKAKDGKG